MSALLEFSVHVLFHLVDAVLPIKCILDILICLCKLLELVSQSAVLVVEKRSVSLQCCEFFSQQLVLVALMRDLIVKLLIVFLLNI